jgi:hypothetical protein
MHITRLKVKSRNGRTYTSVLIQESYRDPDHRTPRKRTLANITQLPDALIAAIERAITLMRGGQAPVVVCNEMRPTPDASPDAQGSSLGWGGIAVARDALERSGMLAALSVVPRQARPLVVAMVLQRLLQPDSKCGLVSWAPTTMLPDVLDIPAQDWNEDRIYRAMDALPAQHAMIEQRLFARHAPDGVRMALYDLSSLYSHGNGCALHRYGHSSDHREDRKQVMVGLVTDAGGMPISLHLLRGNRTSATSLVPCLRRLARRFGLTRMTIVNDGGFVSEANLAYLQEHGYGAITRLSRARIAAVLEECGVEHQPDLCASQGYQVFWHEGTRYCLCYSPWRAARDSARRTARMTHAQEAYASFTPGTRSLHAQTAQLTRLLIRTKAGKYFTIVERAGRMALEENTTAVRVGQGWDGHYLLVCTDATVPDRDILPGYKQLQRVEDDFKVVKSVLEARPMYHWKLRRIHGHLMVCFLALWLERWMAQRFMNAGVTTNVTTVLRDLQHIARGVITVPGARVPLHTLNNLTQQRRALLAQLGLLAVVMQHGKQKCS